MERQGIAFYGGRAMRLPGQGLTLHIGQPANAYNGSLYLGLELGSLLDYLEKVLGWAEFRVKSHKHSIADDKV
jgi:hypothetical protein